MWFGSIRALPYLIERVPIGSNTPILPSQLFFLCKRVPEDCQPPLLTVHHTNWMSAEDSPDSDKEVVGKLDLAPSDSKFPHLGSMQCGRARKNHMWVYPLRATL